MWENEVRNKAFKRGIQTIIYLPRFVSWTVMAGIVINMLAYNGAVNTVITALGGEPVNFLMDQSKFRAILVITTILKDAGWGSIIYFAAISGVSPELYEACIMDGGNRWTQMWHVTLPSIRPTITIMLILTIGNILIQDTQQVLTLYSPNVYSTGDIPTSRRPRRTSPTPKWPSSIPSPPAPRASAPTWASTPVTTACGPSARTSKAWTVCWK